MMKKRSLLLIIGVLLVMGLFGCGTTKYNLIFDDSDLKSEKMSYAEGEEVTVTYDMIASDTDYSFYTDSDDVKLNQTYDNNIGYIFTFTMPAHDVKMFVTSRNSMEMDPDANSARYDGDWTPKDYIKDSYLLFDYYEATVATVGGDESEEYCLYEYTDEELVLARYSKSEDSEETMVYCTVPTSVLDDCMDLVKKYKMRKWKDGAGLRGMTYVVKFMDDGELKRVSSDDMPENGSEAFRAIRNVLGSAWGQYYSSLDTETWFCPECGTKNDRRYCMECGLEKPE